MEADTAMRTASRYREARTLVRRLVRLPGEDRDAFRAKRARLRDHFERFNADVGGLCQWLMGLRKRHGDPDTASFGVLGDFLLEPTVDGIDADEAERDRWRLHVFDDLAGMRPADALSGRPIPDALRDAMDDAAQALPDHAAALRLWTRLRELQPAHRLVLLKAAAEWVVARYRRGVENWVRQRAEWAKEKAEWEGRHPQLTSKLRERFNAVFKSLMDPEKGGTGVTRKNPRICTWERLRQNIDNCMWAGGKPGEGGGQGHAPLCWKYAKFVSERWGKEKKQDAAKFAEWAQTLAELCRKYNVSRAGPALQSQRILDELFAADQRRKVDKDRAKNREPRPLDPRALQKVKPESIRGFKAAWAAYLKAMDLNDSTAIARGRLPHCLKIGRTWEESDCQWNPHTDLCTQYRRALVNPDNRFTDADLALEGVYREWRRLYLAGPRKPVFKYPSGRDLPMPKIFGKDFFEIDMERSILRLRLDDMPAGEWMEFGFVPWPRKYTPSRKQAAGRITSVHVNFIGVRARAGFRFDAPHAASRLGCSQDEIDDLRSRVYPRHAQDQAFLDAARGRLLGSFRGGPPTAEKDLRILAVDVGENGACGAVYVGRRHVKDIPLEIVKIDHAYKDLPTKLEPNPRDPKLKQRPAPLELAKDDARGVRKEHVARHYDSIAAGAEKIAEFRQRAAAGAPGAPTPPEDKKVALGDHDFRSLHRHIAWMIRDWARHNAARIIAAAEEHRCDLVVFESQRGPRPRSAAYDKLGEEAQRQKRALAFAFGRVRRKVAEKAVERGMRVVTVPYFKSSRFCSACGHETIDANLWRKNKREHRFECYCGDSSKWPKARAEPGKPAPAPTPPNPGCACTAKLNSDANAARVLARVFWGEIVLPSPDGEE